ncbi:hypothetical protein [Streptomyces sp. NPDC004008]
MPSAVGAASSGVGADGSSPVARGRRSRRTAPTTSDQVPHTAPTPVVKATKTPQPVRSRSQRVAKKLRGGASVCVRTSMVLLTRTVEVLV